ncbi:Actin cross-linking [Penicillium crustosum]|uniref:Actin cross-linking n=1 Tax=Penicillium crustosum TaxID=36656 RepID=UPI002385EA47|nr:Actin cross-linking [Penicillium crustosum]KAJ5412319.1 Actin cross-linking [Penicillium crustosum]
MVKPLTFKGDKPKKRKTRTIENDARAPKSRKTEPEPEPEDNPEDQSWVSADSPSDIAGPVIIVLPSDDPTCVASDANGQVFASKLENLVDGDPGTAEPHDVRQVWVASRVAGTESFSFKGHHGNTNPSSQSPPRKSRGHSPPQTHGGDGESFLSIKENSKAASGVEIRGDANTISFETTVRVRMQARFKPKLRASKESKAYEKISKKELEGIVGRGLNDDEVKRLRKGRREGNFHEVLLDVKVSGKHDKWA